MDIEKFIKQPESSNNIPNIKLLG